MIVSARHVRSGTDSTYLARPLRRPVPLPDSLDASMWAHPRRCPYCDALAAEDHLTCNSAECLARYEAFTAAMTKILEELPHD